MQSVKLLLILFALICHVQAKSCLPLKSSGINVHLIPHSHDDVGWKETVQQYYGRVRLHYFAI